MTVSRGGFVVALFLLLALAAAAPAAAQTVDVAQISCKQFLIGDIVRRDYLVLWLSGYYNGTHKDTIVETSTVQRIADKVASYCRSNLDTLLMDAVENTLGVTK